MMRIFKISVVLVFLGLMCACEEKEALKDVVINNLWKKDFFNDDYTINLTTINQLQFSLSYNRAIKQTYELPYSIQASKIRFCNNSSEVTTHHDSELGEDYTVTSYYKDSVCAHYFDYETLIIDSIFHHTTQFKNSETVIYQRSDTLYNITLKTK